MELVLDKELEKDFKNYGAKFQLSSLRLLVEDRPFGVKLKDTLLAEYFDNKYHKWFCDIILNFIITWKTSPDYDYLERKIVENFESEEQVEVYKSVLNKISKADISKRSYIEDEIQKFCNTRKIIRDLSKAIDLAKVGEFDKSSVLSKEAYKGIKVNVDHFDLKQDWKKVIEEPPHFPIAMPFETFNKNSKGGPGRGALALCMAPTNFGKTAWLTALARQAAIDGKNVLYISLETETWQIATRLLSGLIDIPQEMLKFNLKQIEQAVSDLPSNVIFKRYKSKQANVETIKNEIDDLKAEGFFPDLVCVDYLQLLKPPKGSSTKTDNEKIEMICEDLRDLAIEEHILMWSAIQTNRSGQNAEYSDEAQVSKAIESLWVSDFFMAYSQTPQQAAEGICHATLLKNRFGGKGIVLKVQYDPNKGTFVELDVLDRSTLLLNVSKNEKDKMVKSIDKLQNNLITNKMKKSII